MNANLFEHETSSNRDKLNQIWDRISPELSIHEMEKEFTVIATEKGFTESDAVKFLMGDPSI